MLEDTLMNLGFGGVALAVFWDNNKRSADAMNKLSVAVDGFAAAVRACPVRVSRVTYK